MGNLTNRFRKTNLNKMTIIYRVKKSEYLLRIFGKKFLDNNKDNCQIMINDEIKLLSENIILDDTIKEKDTLEIKLIEINTITDMSSIFANCKNLISVPDISEWDFKNVTNITNMFSYCESLITLPDISKWDISQIKSLSGIFSHCHSLESLPEINKWNTSNINDMSWIFSFCYNLKSLPDISQWDTSNVNNMSIMFSYCTSLI